MDDVMTAFRLIPLPLHGALEMLTGLFTMAAPFLFGFEPAATVVAVTVGALMVGLALAATAASDPAARARGGISVSAHHAADYGVAIGLVGAAVLLAADGDAIAGLTLALIATVSLLLNLSTRYSVR